MTPAEKAKPKEEKADFSQGARIDKLEEEVAYLKQIIAQNLGIAV